MGRSLPVNSPPPGRLTADDVRAIRRLVAEERVTIKDLAAAYGLSRRSIENAVHGHTWKSVPGAVPVQRNATWLRGEKSPLSKLRSAQVRGIRRLRKEEGWSYAAIAHRFDVSVSTISAIMNGRLWTHLT